jgi:hypothetical protein
MTSALNILTFLTTLLCSVLLLRGWTQVRRRLLLWSGLCFAGLSVNYLLVIVDLMIFPEKDLFTYRLGFAATAMTLLLYGLIWESQ